MNKTAEKDSSMKKAIHYGTIIAIFILIIPASSSSSIYMPIVLVLFGVNFLIVSIAIVGAIQNSCYWRL